ncbi:MAG: glycosyltransferase, partial [Phenylobacterium sp.]
AAAFGRRGFETRVADLEESGQALDRLGEEIAGERFDLVFSIGLFGELRDSAGRTVSEITGGPHVVQYVDYPLSHYFRLASTPADTALLVVDPTHVDAVRSVYGPDRFRHVAFSPHGAIGEPHPIEPDAAAFMAARDIPVMFPGSLYKPGPVMWAEQSPATRRVFDAAVEEALACEFIPALDALDHALDQHGGHITAQQRSDMRVNAFAVHERVRSHRRVQMVEAAAKAGFQMVIFGAGYQDDAPQWENVTFGGQRPLAEIAEFMGRTQVVLNMNANFGQGSHERPLSAMLAGAAAATDASGFYEAEFGSGEIIQLRWMSLDEDLAALLALLGDPGRLYDIAARGQARALAGHRWDHRVDAILAAADAVRA